jgi:hypothetical protein
MSKADIQDIIDEDPSVSKSNMWTSFGFSLLFEILSQNSPKTMGKSPKVLNLNWLFSETQPLHL